MCAFPRYGRWKAQQAAKEERRKSRAERRARGEDVSEDEEGVDEPPEESLFMGVGKLLLLLLVCTALAGQFITGSPLWGYKGKWTNIHTYLKPFKVSRLMTNLPLRVTGLYNICGSQSDTLFTEEHLAKFDGTNPALPIYLAVRNTQKSFLRCLSDTPLYIDRRRRV